MALALHFSTASGQAFADSARSNLLPLPAHQMATATDFRVSPRLRIQLQKCPGRRASTATARFIERLNQRTGLKVEVDQHALVTIDIVCGPGSFADESYHLNVSQGSVTISSKSSTGTIRALATLLELVVVDDKGFALQGVDIQDVPRFRWRGLMIDVARHFVPFSDLERQLDLMEAVKLNVLHLHLSDREGFRVESRKYPRLQKTQQPSEYYTQLQIRRLVKLADERGIIIEPEFDMPAHSRAILAAYPELASGPLEPPNRAQSVDDSVMDPTKAQTMIFVTNLFGELTKLFPGQYFHIGGDEVHDSQWKKNGAIQKYMRGHDLRDSRALQAEFTLRLRDILMRHGKTMVGWDEVADGGVPGDVVVQGWRSSTNNARLLRKGYNVIVSSGYYLDRNDRAIDSWKIDPLDPNASGIGQDEYRAIRASPLAAFVPEAMQLLPSAPLSEDEAGRVLGGEAALWTEIVSSEKLDISLWPRAAAIADRFWSPASNTNGDDMYRRLLATDDLLVAIGGRQRIAQIAMATRLSPPGDDAAARLLTAVEPVRGFGHNKTFRGLPSQTLNELADAAAPDIARVRTLERLAKGVVDGRAEREDFVSLRDAFQCWATLVSVYRVAAERAAPLRDALPTAERVSAMASAGLELLASYEGGTVSAERRSAIKALLDEESVRKMASSSVIGSITAKQPEADLLLAFDGVVRTLLDGRSASPAGSN